MKKKMICIIVAFVLVFAFAASALAATTSYTYSGSAYKNFITSGSLTKSSSESWSSYRVYLDEIDFTGELYAYIYARPQGTDETLFSSKKKVYWPEDGPTDFTPNTSGTSANTVKFKIYNPNYEEDDVTNNRMTVSGSVRGYLG